MQRTIDSTLVPEFKEKFGKISRKAAKLGLPLPSFEIIKTALVEDTRYEAYGIILPETPMRSMSTIEISDVDVVIAGNWKVVGEIKGEAFEGVKSASGKSFNDALYIEFEPLPKECYEKNPMLCEHCNTNRYRKYTYILKNLDDGRYIQVGSSCVEDFVHVKNLDSILKWLEDLSCFLLVEGQEERTIIERAYYPWLHVASLMKYAVYIVDTKGYTRHKADNKEFVSSAKRLYNMIVSDKSNEELVAHVEEKANIVIEHFKNRLDELMRETSFDAKSLNLAKTISSEYISTEYNSLDILCYAVYRYNNYMETKRIELAEQKRAEERARQREELAKQREEERLVRERRHAEYEELKANSGFVGEIGDELDTDAILTNVLNKTGAYGDYKICSFNVNGNIVKCFVNEKNKAYEALNNIVVDSKVHISGNIKSHDVYNGVKSTMFKNIKIQP